MIYVKVNAGLCNQIYRFAAAYALAREWNEELIIDPDIDGVSEFTYLLDEFEMPSYKKAVYPIRYNVGREYLTLLPELKEKVVIIDESYFEQVGEYLTIPKEKFRAQYPNKDIYLKGIFFKRQMFTKYLPDLQKMFTLKTPSPFVQEFEKRTQGVTAIGVHIRKQGFAVLGDDNGIDFFMAGIVYMRKRFKDARFYVFSDELDYVKESLGSADDIFYMDAMNGYRGDIEEFVCLTKCHHYILTRRSTYGRMAEILNESDKKVSVLFGGNTWNDSEERFHFMSAEEVQDLKKFFHKKQIVQKHQEELFTGMAGMELEKALIYIGLDSEAVTAIGRRKIIYEKARLYERKGEYGQAVHLCRLLEEQYGEDNGDFHEYFGDLLSKYGLLREAVVEYICASQKLKIEKEIFAKGTFVCYKKQIGEVEKKHFIIAQFREYSSQYLNQLQIIGLILGRMGNDVSYIFKGQTMEIPESALNRKMMQWESTVNNKYLKIILDKGFSSGRFFYGYPCYEYGSVLDNKGDNLQAIAGKYPDREPIVVGRDPNIISEDVPFRKVFIDFSEPFDEAYLEGEVGEANIRRMYGCADIVVTRKRGCQKNGQKVIWVDENLLDTPKQNVNIPCYEPTIYTEDYLDMALKIADACSVHRE